MSVMQAWNWIFNNWGSPSWKPIPTNVSSILGIDKRVGMYNAMLVTKHGANCAEMSYQQISQQA